MTSAETLCQRLDFTKRGKEEADLLGRNAERILAMIPLGRL
jgi:hypothetical protein